MLRAVQMVRSEGKDKRQPLLRLQELDGPRPGDFSLLRIICAKQVFVVDERVPGWIVLVPNVDARFVSDPLSFSLDVGVFEPCVVAA